MSVPSGTKLINHSYRKELLERKGHGLHTKRDEYS